jgi:hypothetical protein
MSKLRRASESPKRLLDRVLDSPALVAAVRDLPSAALARLIDAVGLEDASELVALATTPQLEHILDDDVWQSEHGGADPEFSAQRFALWLEVLNDGGEAAVVGRLTELPFDFLALGFSRLLLVLDMEQVPLLLAEDESGEASEKALEDAAGETWEEYWLVARDAERFDVVWSALMALERDHHDLLRQLVERIALTTSEYISGNGGLFEVLTSEEMLESDARAMRDDRRATQGYVAPSDARSFLELARQGLGDADERDPVTKAYFRELAQKSAKARVAPATRSSTTRADTARLLRMLERARITTPFNEPSTAKTLTVRQGTLLESALQRLAELDPRALGERREELAYLTNVLISGDVGEDGRAHRPVGALERAIATCELGLHDALASEAPHASGTGPLLVERAAKLLGTVTLDRLFRVGMRWNR